MTTTQEWDLSVTFANDVTEELNKLRRDITIDMVVSTLNQAFIGVFVDMKLKGEVIADNQ